MELEYQKKKAFQKGNSNDKIVWKKGRWKSEKELNTKETNNLCDGFLVANNSRRVALNSGDGKIQE